MLHPNGLQLQRQIPMPYSWLIRRCPDVPNLHQEETRVLLREALQNFLRPKYNVRKLKTFLTPIARRNHRVHRIPVAWIGWPLNSRRLVGRGTCSRRSSWRGMATCL